MARLPAIGNLEPLLAHEVRCGEIQPHSHVFALEQLAKHLEMLQLAVENGDTTKVKQFFNLYVFD